MIIQNKINRNELRERLMQETFRRITISFYRYVILENPEATRDELFLAWTEYGCFGRIYVAREGINAQMNVPEHHLEDFLADLNSRPWLAGVPIKYAVEDDGKSFYKLNIKTRTKIVADGLNDDAFDVTNVGKHLTAAEFNAAMDDSETIVVDMRNHYESEVGHFKGAITPDVDTFREELPLVVDLLKDKKDKKVLLYCTGGIRCEKASAYFKHQGFEDVNQLLGGIIDYARQVKQEGLESKFVGKNFVFDERLGERISDEIISKCHQCGELSDKHTNCVNSECHLLFIQCDKCREKYQNCCSEGCQSVINLPEEEQRARRKIHTKPKEADFKKGRWNIGHG